MGSSIRISAVALVAFGCTYNSIPLPVSPPVAATCYVSSITWEGSEDDPLLYTYDVNHQLLTLKDATGNSAWTMVYDQDHKRAIRNGTRIDTLFFDVLGRLIKHLMSYDSGKNVGEIHTFGYNSFGQLKLTTDVFFLSGNPVPVGVDTIVYEYPDSSTHNYTKTTISQGGGSAGNTLYSYDNKNNPALVTNFPLSLWFDPTVTTNNVTRLETVGGYSHVENYSFTYNEYGYPLTRSGVNENNGPWKEHYTYTDCTFNP